MLCNTALHIRRDFFWHTKDACEFLRHWSCNPTWRRQWWQWASVQS